MRYPPELNGDDSMEKEPPSDRLPLHIDHYRRFHRTILGLLPLSTYCIRVWKLTALTSPTISTNAARIGFMYCWRRSFAEHSNL